MGTTAIPDTLPIGAIVFIIAYLLLCFRAELWHAKSTTRDNRPEPRAKEDNDNATS